MLSGLKNQRERGFTLIELIIVIWLIGFVGMLLFYATLLKGNFYYTQDGVLKALQFEKPNVTKILKTERNIWSYSRIFVEESGARKVYCLDTNVLFNYEFPKECE